MFSSRVKGAIQHNRLSLAIEEHGRSGSELLDLTISNPTRAGLNYSVDVLTSVLGDRRSLVYEPDPKGLLEARRAVGGTYTTPVSPEHIVLTASTSEAYSYLFKLLCDPGDGVLVPRPSYPLFEFLADLEAIEIHQYPLFYDTAWGIDLGALEAAITPDCRAVLLVNPNNPTGSFLKRAEYSELARLCARYGLAIISDEVFSDFSFGSDYQRVQTLAHMDDVLTFSLNGLSKMAGLPQMKLGWMVVSGPEAVRTEALSRLEIIADTFLSVNTAVQWAASTVIETSVPLRNQICQRTSRNLQMLRQMLKGNAIGMLDVEAGWCAILQVPRIRTEEEWVMTLLEKCGVLVQPGYFYDFESEAFLVVSLLTREPIFDEGIGRIVGHL
jgi:alanine-synthesizing transaminase